VPKPLGGVRIVPFEHGLQPRRPTPLVLLPQTANPSPSLEAQRVASTGAYTQMDGERWIERGRGLDVRSGTMNRRRASARNQVQV
jgi:hypothetical protein